MASLVLTRTIVILDTINQGVMQGNATPTRRNFFLGSAPQRAIRMILFQMAKTQRPKRPGTTFRYVPAEIELAHDVAAANNS